MCQTTNQLLANKMRVVRDISWGLWDDDVHPIVRPLVRAHVSWSEGIWVQNTPGVHFQPGFSSGILSNLNAT